MNAAAYFVTVAEKGTIMINAAIGARERVREPGQDRKIATVPHVSVMRSRSPLLTSTP